MKPIENRDDPRLTAYALGELAEGERAAVEQYLQRDPEARALVDELAALGGTLSAALAAEAKGGPGLDSARRAALLGTAGADAGPAHAAGGAARRRAGANARRGSLLRLWVPAAAALVMAVVAWQWSGAGRGGAGGDETSGAVPPVVADALRPEERDERRLGERDMARRDRSFGDDDGLGRVAQDDNPAGAVGLEAAPADAGGAAGVPGDDRLRRELEALGYVAGQEGAALSGKGRVAGGPAARGAVAPFAGEPARDAAASRVSSSKAFTMPREAGLGLSHERPASHAPRLPHTPTGESYAPIVENPFVPITGDPLSALSTFGVDVDSASYSNVRRFLNRGQVPPVDAVRIEELVNAFEYAYAGPDGEHPFAVHLEATAAPWAPEHRLVRIGLKGRAVEASERPPCNLVFLLDVSGSMSSADKLPLLVASAKLLLSQLDEDDTVAIVTYASGSELVLPPTSAAERERIEGCLDGLTAGGSTHASAGIQLAYETAARAFRADGLNRVVLATDGDFNVGITGEGELERFIAEKAKGGVFLTVLGFGTGNLKDSKAEILADRGNGHYAYVDTLAEAHRVLVEQAGATLQTIAKDVKLQVEFNPGRVAAWRLLGYENRALAAHEFRDDRKDAGEIGAGHTVTALYEVVPVGVAGGSGTAELRYQRPPPPPERLLESDELLTVNLRYKQPDGDHGRELAVPLVDEGGGFGEAGADTRFAAAVAAFGMVLRDSPHRGTTDLEQAAAWAEAARGTDTDGRRAEFVRLVRTAQGVLGK